MKMIELFGGQIARVDDEDFEHLSKHRWYLTAGYASRGQWKDGKAYSLLMHREIMALKPYDGRFVDHVNGDPLDNRKENLRICRHVDNMRNRGASKNNTSGFKGVSWHKNRNGWTANIRHR